MRISGGESGSGDDGRYIYYTHPARTPVAHVLTRVTPYGGGAAPTDPPPKGPYTSPHGQHRSPSVHGSSIGTHCAQIGAIAPLPERPPLAVAGPCLERSPHMPGCTCSRRWASGLYGFRHSQPARARPLRWQARTSRGAFHCDGGPARLPSAQRDPAAPAEGSAQR